MSIDSGVAQLFVDDHLIAEHENLRRTLHQPRKDHGGNVPIVSPPPGEKALIGFYGILFDRRLGRYVWFVGADPSDRIYRLTSADGMNWSFGQDGLDADARPEPIRLHLRDPGSAPPRSYYGLSVHYDDADDRYPYKGWLYAANWGNDREGAYFARSRDGLDWQQGELVVNAFAGRGDPSCRVIHQDGRTLYGPGDASTFYYDPVGRRFLGLFKFFTPDRVPPGNNLRSRAFAFFDRLDEPFDAGRIEHIELLPPAAERDGDRPFDEYYSSTAFHYASQWLGELKIWHRGDDYPYSAAGCAFAKLITSRDGLHWRKVPFVNDAGIPEVFIPNGPEGGNNARNDGGYYAPTPTGPLRIGDELIFYYGCTSYGKNHPPDRMLSGGGLFRARLRVDGFVSVDAGTLTTPRLQFTADELVVNAVGPLRVEILSAQGGPIAGADVLGDSFRHQVRFDGKPLGEIVPPNSRQPAAGSAPSAANSPAALVSRPTSPGATRTARLRFTVGDGGRLYSFTLECQRPSALIAPASPPVRPPQ